MWINRVDTSRPLKARIMDADLIYHGVNNLVVDVQCIVLPHPPYTQQPEIIYNGGRSSCFELLPQDWEVSE